MKLNTRHDLDAPINEVFDALSDTAKWERAATRHQIDMKRTDGATGFADGASWNVKASFRGKAIDAALTVTKHSRPGQMVLLAKSGLFDADIEIELTELSEKKTRVGLTVEVKPNTLGARIMLQSFKLGKTKIQKKFNHTVKKTLGELGGRLAKTKPE
jgi:carbon monoxide dehydrogenase subunit G